MKIWRPWQRKPRCPICGLTARNCPRGGRPDDPGEMIIEAMGDGRLAGL